MAKNRPHPNDDQRGGYVRALVTKKAANGNGNGATSYVCDWSIYPSHILARLIWAVNIQGGSLLFGQTRNGHSYTLGLFTGTDKATWYFNRTDEGYEEFVGLAESIIEAALNSPEGVESPFLGR